MTIAATSPAIDALVRHLPEDARTLLSSACAAADESGTRLWVVGGAVRDLLAGRAFRDVDVTIDGDPTGLAEAVAEASRGLAAEEPRFLTASVALRSARLDIARLRRERYSSPGALPTVEPASSIEEDLLRRDFTVNAIALGASSKIRDHVVDPLDGRADLQARRLCALHAGSFRDDATRLWRGARVASALRLRPDPQTAAWIAESTRWLEPISARRLWAEFVQTAAQRRTLTTLRTLDAWGVLRGIEPGWRFDHRSEGALRHRPGPHAPAMLLALLLAPIAAREEVIERLQPPRGVQGAVRDAARLLSSGGEDPAALERLTSTGDAGRTAARWLDPPRQAERQRALERWERTRPPLTAADLLRLGVPEGPQLGELLWRLRRARFLGTLINAAEARRTVRRWLQEGAG